MAKKTNIDSLNPKHHIIIKGAKVNNLKNLSVAFPRNKLTVVTGLFGLVNLPWYLITFLPKVKNF